ncbi:MAG TPA: sigma-70 family RNA polymerase sigma factor [Chthoniobacterales bacterium]|nr:sigma-70 family RNA polymerase sigma factor [Chthoniobacterales bacterium]
MTTWGIRFLGLRPGFAQAFLSRGFAALGRYRAIRLRPSFETPEASTFAKAMADMSSGSGVVGVTGVTGVLHPSGNNISRSLVFYLMVLLSMNDQGQRTRFENQMLPLMPEAYNLARWFMKNEPDARDAVQEAYLKAFRYFESFQGDSGRAWLLRIVRNVCYDALRAKQSEHNIISLDEEAAAEVPDSKPGPNVLAIQNSTKLRIREALEALPLEFKTVIILREFDGFSYKEISDIVGVPIGTVMSRLSRARQQLAILLQKERENE